MNTDEVKQFLLKPVNADIKKEEFEDVNYARSKTQDYKKCGYCGRFHPPRKCPHLVRLV